MDRTLVHEALLYRNAEELGTVVRELVLAASAAGEPVLILLPPRNLDLMKRALGDAAGGEVRFEDMYECAGNPNRLLPLYQDWIDDHAGPVRVVGELIWPGRRHAEVVECLRHEALLNHALASAPASILCPYDAQNLDAETLAGAELTHPQLVDAGRRRRSEAYGEPLEVHAGMRWPQAPVNPRASKHACSGNLHALRRALASDPVADRLDSGRRADLVFVVNETVTNALRHGDGTCVIRLWHDDSFVIAEVWTASVIADASAGRRRPQVDAPSGRGLWLINQLCDLVELRTNETGTTLRMHLRDSSAAEGV